MAAGCTDRATWAGGAAGLGTGDRSGAAAATSATRDCRSPAGLAIGEPQCEQNLARVVNLRWQDGQSGPDGGDTRCKRIPTDRDTVPW
jgi:hypothetical protein